MPVESAADRLVFLAADEFGAVGRYESVLGRVVPALAGIFDRPADTVGASTSYTDAETIGIGSTTPRFLCRAADLPEDAGDEDRIRITVDGVDAGLFVVRLVEPDGTGLAALVLEEATS